MRKYELAKSHFEWVVSGEWKERVARIADVDIRLLRVFLAVVESGGFSAAQTVLNVGIPTISLHMSELERRIGFRLCSRGSAGSIATASGETGGSGAGVQSLGTSAKGSAGVTGGTAATGGIVTLLWLVTSPAGGATGASGAAGA